MEKFDQVHTSVENLDYELTDKELDREDLDRFQLENGYEVGDGYTKEVSVCAVVCPSVCFFVHPFVMLIAKWLFPPPNEY